MNTLIHCLALVGAVSILVSLAIGAFFLWFTYDSRQTAKQLDAMSEDDDDSN